jgi:uncharacterized membrane protein
MPHKRDSIRYGLLVATLCAIGFAAYGAFEGHMRGNDGPSLFPVVASFACIGLLFGAVFAFDPLPTDRIPNRPGIRILLSSVAGLCLGLVWSWSVEGIALSTLAFAVLGYFGTAWAKYL